MDRAAAAGRTLPTTAVEHELLGDAPRANSPNGLSALGELMMYHKERRGTGSRAHTARQDQNSSTYTGAAALTIGGIQTCMYPTRNSQP